MRHATNVNYTRLQTDADRIAMLQRVRAVAGVAVVGSDPHEDASSDEDRFCGCGNLLLDGLLACSECEPVGAMHRRYEGTWRIGLAAGGR